MSTTRRRKSNPLTVGQWFQDVTTTFIAQINSAKDLGLRARLGGVADVEAGAGAGANAGAVAKAV